MDEYVIISKKELDIKKGEIFLSLQEVQELVEYSDTFKKYLNKKIHEIQASLGKCELQGKENQAYIAIETIIGIIKGLDKTQNTLQKFKEKQT